MRIRLLAVVGLAGLIAGCGGSGPSINADDVDRVVLSDGGAVTVTVVDKKVIGLLARAVNSAVVEEGTFPVRKLRTVDFQSGGESLVKLKYYGVLFDIGETQYSDETNTLGVIANGMLTSGAPLYGEVECEKSLPAGGNLSLKYTVTNAGEESVTIAARFRALTGLLRIPEDQTKPDTEILSRPGMKLSHLDVDGKDPVVLAPGASHVYTFMFQTRGVGAGQRALSIRFVHRDEEPPAGQAVPPSVSGIILTFH